MPVYLPVSLSLCLPVCLSVCLSSSIVLLNPLHTRHAMYERSASSSSRPVRKRRNVSLIIYIYIIIIYLTHYPGLSPFLCTMNSSWIPRRRRLQKGWLQQFILERNPKAKHECDVNKKRRKDKTRQEKYIDLYRVRFLRCKKILACSLPSYLDL